ncbi:aminomethyl-transferring glycine dehydrogenase subunit GcvPA [Rickettsiales bacterium]|nr:aminomethyl-transferring glycine dehydrogenase subunit GcvPA [Rickettsiales bacterium]
MRYLPQTKKNRQDMLASIGVNSVDDLFKNIPNASKIDGLANLPLKQSELAVERKLANFANENVSASKAPFFLGAGCYYHHVPATVDHIIQRSEFLTAYTPYQPEISQGTLIALFEFQTMIAMLTGQEVANASMYDGATATAEAALMALRLKKKCKNIHVLDGLNPQYEEVLRTYVQNYDDVNIKSGLPDADAACVIIQTPDFYGTPHNIEDIRKKCDETGTILIVVVSEIVSLGLLPPPALADIVVGEGQSIGNAMSFGGPHLGFFATKMQYIRQMPGRVCGQTTDEEGRQSFVLTLNTREQHIRREKATSNICTNQGLCALAFTIHMALLGDDGLKKLARINHKKACDLADALEKIDSIKVLNDNFFNEFVVQLPKSSQEIIDNLAKKGIIAGLALEENKLLVAATEMTTDEDIEKFAAALRAEID